MLLKNFFYSERLMSSPCQLLINILRTVRRPGEFQVNGSAELFMPRIEVEGVGPLSLPLPLTQAEQLIAHAVRAPYGRGEDTVVDMNVRRTWQIEAGHVRISGRNWQQTLENIIAQCAAGLGVDDPIVAEFYKLLVYDEGSFFVPHRDTEKIPGMFATLVIVLPSIYTGGELIVRHGDREARIDLYRSEPSEAAFAAFYADCVHEVLPVKSGCRLTLIYNLVRNARTQPIEPPRYDNQQTQVTALLQRWVKDRLEVGDGISDDDTTTDEREINSMASDLVAEEDEDDEDDEDKKFAPEKLIYLLEHAYTPAELSFGSLKGADAAIAPVLSAAAAAANCELYLAFAAIEESGSAEHEYSPRSRGRWRRSRDEEYEDDNEEEDETFVIDEIFEHHKRLSTWICPDGSHLEMGRLPFLQSELCPPNAFEGMKPTKQHFQEATGNEGASFDRTYQRVALVLWPRERTLAVVNQGGLLVTLPYLDKLANRWGTTDDGQESSRLWAQAHTLSGYMLRDWPLQPNRRSYWQPQAPSYPARMLAILARLRDSTRIDVFLSRISAVGIYDGNENEELIHALALLPPQRATELITAIITANAMYHLKACVNLLALCVAESENIALESAAMALIAAFPGDPAHKPKSTWYQSPAEVTPEIIVNFLTTLARIGASVLASRTVDHLLAWPETFTMDGMLVPIALHLVDLPVTRGLEATRCLRATTLNHLRQRIAEPLAPPTNWTRANILSCKCRHCVELAGFLSDPESRVWNFKSSEKERGHVMSVIQRGGCDIDCTTERHGRPYTLHCVKNQASYERRVQQRLRDLADQKHLEP